MADSPNEQALRSRVKELYAALRQGDWRKVEKHLTKASRRVYRTEPKKTVADYQIDSIKLDASGQTAEVVVRLPAPSGMGMGGPPVFIPQTTLWRREGGQWCMELPDPHAAHRPPGAGDQQPAPTPHFSINSTDLKFETTWASVGFVHQGETKVARFPFRNVSQRTVTLADVQSTCPCLKSTSQQKEFKPGEAGTIELTFDPSSFSFKTRLGLTLTVSVQTEPEHAITQLTVGAALLPANEPPAQPPPPPHS